MKKNLLLFLSIVFSVISYAQTYPVQDVDECVFLTAGFQQNSTYTSSVANPVGSDVSSNVSSITPTSAGTTTTFGTYFTLPYNISTGTVVNWAGRFFTANAGDTNVGSGRLRIQIQNNSIGGSTAITIAEVTNTGGSWQAETVSGFTATSGNATTDANIDANGGYNTFIIQQLNPLSSETLYFDNIEFSINPNLTDENANLESGNVWIHNNRTGNNQLTPSNTFGATAVDANIATPSTVGNSASTALRYTKANSFSLLRFNIPPLTPPFSGTVKFRVYLDNCAPDLDNRMSIQLRNSSNNSYTSSVVSITDKKWNEISFDLSSLSGSVSASYDFFEIIVDLGDNANKDGFVYYFDAIQGPFAGATTFTGATNNSWTTASNWTNGVPNELYNATIQTGNTVGVFGAVASTNDLTLEGDASINIQGASPELLVKGNFTIGTGSMFFRRNVSAGTWYLVSPPIGGVTFTDSSLSTGTTNTDNRGIGTYNTSSDDWTYKQVNVNLVASNGKGYSLNTTASPYTFTGNDINDADVPVAVGIGGNGGFNLIGNPFSASMNSASFLTANTADLTSETIWLWNGSAYETKVTADNFVLAPTQGFFVSANKGTNLTISKSSQTTGGTFQKGNGGKTEIRLNMTDGAANRFAKLYYFDNNVTTGFDNGYDGETFGGQPDAVDVFTHLVTDSQGKNYQVQSLPKNDMENLVVPVGIKAQAGKEITFTAEATNLPNGLNVYLEDRESGTFTKLTSSTTYKVTLTNALNGIGRFYLHTAAKALSTDDVALSSISIYSTSKNTLRIAGLDTTEGDVTIYNILGRKVVDQKVNSKGVFDVKLPNLSTGIYIINVSTEKGNISKKIVLE